MNDPHSLPDSGTLKTESGFLFNDWNLPDEKGPTDSATLFDGKIIARMPDLGSENIAKSIGKPKFLSFWGQVCASALSIIQGGTSNDVAIRRQFFHRVTALGGIVLLCGIGILLTNPNKNKSTDAASDVAGISAGTTGTSETKPPFPKDSSFFPVLQKPIVQQEAGNVMPVTLGDYPGSAIPVASVESVAAVSPPSPWARPAADSHPSWEPPPRQPEDPFLPINVAVVPSGQPGTVTMSPMTPIGEASMPVSPFEMQLLAQSNAPTHPLAGTHVQPNHSTVSPGMMPMLLRQENTPQDYNIPQQFPPAGLGHAPVNNNSYGQAGPQNQYAVPPGYMLPPRQAAPVEMPIPSGVSTLPPQSGGQYMHVQPLGTPVQRPPSDFFTPPPASSRLM